MNPECITLHNFHWHIKIPFPREAKLSLNTLPFCTHQNSRSQLITQELVANYQVADKYRLRAITTCAFSYCTGSLGILLSSKTEADFCTGVSEIIADEITVITFRVTRQKNWGGFRMQNVYAVCKREDAKLRTRILVYTLRFNK